MSKKLRVISINLPFADANVVHTSLHSDRALFDFDVVVIRPQQFEGWAPHFDATTCAYLQTIMEQKRVSSIHCSLRAGSSLFSLTCQMYIGLRVTGTGRGPASSITTTF